MTAEIEGFIRDAAMQRGIDPEVALRVARSEGGVNEYCAVGKFDTGWSFWPFQLHFGGPGFEQYGTVAGMGTGFTKLTGWQPNTDPPWRDSVRYALNRAKASGWGAWYGAAHVGIAQWEGIDTSYSWDANAETWDYEQPIAPTTLVYNPLQPPERQVQDWTCSIRSTAWALKSLGLPVDIGELQDEMTPRYVTPELGLLDGRGYGIASVLREHLPGAWGERVYVFEQNSWDDLVARAGGGPMCVGLHGAYHWLNVAMQFPDGTLSSPNPAPKYPQGTPIGDILTRDEVEHYGPVSAVWIDAAGAGSGVPPVVGGPDPSDPFAPYRSGIGSGLIEMLEADGTTPAQRSSTWYPFGATPSDVETIYGANGVLYVYLLTQGKGFRVSPNP